MAKVFWVLVFVTACSGTAFTDDLFQEQTDAHATLETDSNPQMVNAPEASPFRDSSAPDAAGLGDAATNDSGVGIGDASTVDACDCTDLCKMGDLRVCESCIEVCPTYEGGLP